jgi:hypothetical protein
MRRLALLPIVAAVAFAPAGAPAAKRQVLRANGLAVVAPPGWHLTRERLTECTSPTQVMAITDGRGRFGLAAKIPHARTLILFLEDRMYHGDNFQPRPRFRVPRLGLIGGCCEMPISRGFEVFFRDHGRNLYAFVYVATRGNAVRAVAMLNTLAVTG